MTRTVLLVEGESDRTAVLTVAARMAVDLSPADVVVMGGITNLDRHLRSYASSHRVCCLYDAAEASHVEQVIRKHGDFVLELFACDQDLEDELIRSLGISAVLAVIEGAGDINKWHTLRRQPHQRDRADREVLRRFFGTTSGRKDKYAALLVHALDPDRIPAPLAAALTSVANG